LIKEYKGLEPLMIARILVTVPKDVKKRYDKNVSVITDEHFEDIFYQLSEGRIVTDAVPELLAELAESPELEVKDLLGDYRRIGTSKLVDLIKKIVKENKDLSFKQLMGLVMKEVRGRESGDKISIILKEVLGE
jgi:glutamyl-tRNA(Gln) amidotransferase subunit E